MNRRPTVTAIVPTFMEEAHIEACLDALGSQTMPLHEVLVVDGRSSDRTRALAEAWGARVLDNPLRIQSAAMNVGLAAASGEVVVRIDGHCVVDADYVERCLEALESTGASMVGGAMRPVATTPMQRCIAAAMASPLGAGPARFHVGGNPGWVDTVYLGAYRTLDAHAVGGYATDVGVNEDAEFAHRMGERGGVWFDPSIRSTYVPRESLRSVARQFWRYGRSRAMTMRRHPRSVSWRQLMAPALIVGLLSPFRRPVANVYAAAVAVETLRTVRLNGGHAAGVAVVLPAMHLSWGAGALVGLVGAKPPRSISPVEPGR